MTKRLTIDESRRLTGPNLLTDYPGAVLELFIEGFDHKQVIKLWEQAASELLDALNLPVELHSRDFEDGVSLYLRADEDKLYAACEINEAAVEQVREALMGEHERPELKSLAFHNQQLVEEANPELMAILHEAQERGVTCLVDDDELSLGMGPHCEVWPVRELPAIDSIDWAEYKDIEVALITGTNGKSTSVRLCDAIVKASGISAGITSTDYIRAGSVILDRGDYSGPGGARTLLRDHRTELGLLEVARGGMLRRGLGTNRARAALVTNVADDHLGQFGINTVEALTGVKSMVARALNQDGTLVINADDAGVVKYYKNHPDLVRGKLCYFSLDADNPLLSEGDEAFYLKDDAIVFWDGDSHTSVADVNAIPCTLKGAARHNVANCLGAAGLCHAMGVSLEHIQKGLEAFKSDNEDNPGRGNRFKVNGAEVIVDFAHNAHSLTAVVDMVRTMPAERKLIMLGHAGDRTDRDIANLTEVAIRLNPDMVITSDLPEYLRGREMGEIPALIRRQFLEAGLSEEQIVYTKDNFEGAKWAIDWAKPGDLLLLLALDQRDEIFELLNQKAAH